MRSPDVCVHVGGHSSGRHQLPECEVQPQAKASLACGDKLDPPLPPPHARTRRTRTSPHSVLPSSFKEFTLRQYGLLGLPLALGQASAPESSVFTRNDYRGNVTTQKCFSNQTSIVVFKSMSNNPSALCCTPVNACNYCSPNKGQYYL